jgi:phosphate-selective porin OprO and OprP
MRRGVWRGTVSAAAVALAIGGAQAAAAQESPPATQAQEGQGMEETGVPTSDADAYAAPMATGDGAQVPPAPSSAEQRISDLEQQIAALAEQIADLKQSTGSQVRSLRDTLETTQVKVDNGRLTVERRNLETNTTEFSVALRGVIHLDSAIYDQDEAETLALDPRRGSFGDATEAARARDLNSGANFRRARIGIEGKAFTYFDYALIGEFGGSGVEEGGRINDFWVQYSGFDPRVRIKAGAFAPPTGLEEVVSTNGSLFMERASPAETVRAIAGGDGRTGVGVLSNGEKWNLSGVITGQVIGSQNFDEQLAFVGRATYVPFRRDDTLVHVGVNTTWVMQPADAGPDVTSNRYPLRLRDRPELRVDGTRLVDTGNLDADGLVTLGLEFGAMRKNAYIQAEYVTIDVDRRVSALSDPQFNGWYVQGSYIFNKDVYRRYQTANAGFDGPRVEADKAFNLKNGTWGVWELGLRYSNLDLNDNEGSAGFLPVDAVRGGEQQIWTLGLNWYLNNTVRLMFQAQDIDVDRLSPGGSVFGGPAPLTPPAGVQVGQDLQTYALRTQVAF